MKIKIEQTDLFDTLKKVQNIVENRTTMPILKNILLKAENDQLEIFATNLEVSLRNSKPANVLVSGQVVVNAKSFCDLVREIGEGEISLEKKESSWLEIKQKKAVYNLVGVSPDEYPIFPTFKTKNFMSIEKEIFIEMIDKTIFSVSNDEKRFHLNGVYLEQTKQDNYTNFKMVSTDGHRLSFISRKIKGEGLNSGSEKGVIIPRKGLNEIKKLLENSSDKFKLAIEGSQLIIKSADTVLMVRLIEGEFPNYKKLIPSDLDQNIYLDKEQFFSSLRRVSLLSNQKSKGVVFSFSKGRIEITSNNPELGDAKEELDVDYSGGDIKIGFNAKFILDVLTNIQGDKVTIKLKNKLSPSLVQPKDDKTFTCVIMPMHIQ